MLEVREFNDLAKLAALQTVWNRLLEETAGADFFRSFAWLETYWRHYGADQTLRVLSIHKNDTVVGILPLVVARRRTKLGRLRVLKFPLDYWGSFYGPIGPQAKQTLQAGLRHVINSPRDWDYIDLGWLPDSPYGAGAVVDAAQGLMVTMLPSPDNGTAVAELRGGWEAYWASRSRNWRSNCRRNAKKTEAAGDVEYVRYRPRGAGYGDGDPRWDLYDEVRELAGRSWQGCPGGGTTMSHEEVAPFLRDVHLAAARDGNLDVNLLRINGQAVAFNYNYHLRGYVSSLRLGFDPAFAKSGVGTVLTQRMIEDSCRRGDHTLDFLPGSIQVKRHWKTSLRNSLRFEHLPMRSGRVALIRLKREMSAYGNSAIGRLLLSS